MVYACGINSAGMLAKRPHALGDMVSWTINRELAIFR